MSKRRLLLLNMAPVAMKELGGVASTSSPSALANRVVSSPTTVEDNGTKARRRQEWQWEGKKAGFWHGGSPAVGEERCG